MPETTIINKLLPKSNERAFFSKLLDNQLVSGESLRDAIYRKSEEEAKSLQESSMQPKQEILAQFLTDRLKARQISKIPLYEYMIRQVVEELHPNFSTFHKQLDQGKLSVKEAPHGYPTIHKEASILLNARISESVDESTYYQYLSHKALSQKFKELKKIVIQGINKFGLHDDELSHFALLMYQINELCVTDSKNAHLIVERVVKGIAGETVDLVHVKCLRFTYPIEGGVKILTNTEDVVLEGVQGRYIPKSETLLFPRLLNIKDLFTRYGINVSFTIVISDDDLDLLYPEGNAYVSPGNLAQAKIEAHEYQLHLQKMFGSQFIFTSMSELKAKAGNRYSKFRLQVLSDVLKEGGKFVNPDFFEKDRVDHQYEYYQRLLGKDYSRHEARRSIAEQTASIIALKELLIEISPQALLFEEDRGGENSLIANNEFGIVFTKLRDVAQFDVQ